MWSCSPEYVPEQQCVEAHVADVNAILLLGHICQKFDHGDERGQPSESLQDGQGARKRYSELSLSA